MAFTIWLLLGCSISSTQIPTEKKTTNTSATQPNVLMILVDDLKPALGVYGDPIAISPNIDKLAAQGMRFERAYVNQAVCMASRYNLMLGSRSTSSGLYNFGVSLRERYPQALTLPQLFKSAGYHAEAMGKVYHIGHGTIDDTASWSRPHRADKVIEYILPQSTGGTITREEGMFTNASWRDGINNMKRPRGAAWEAPDVLDEAYADGRIATHAVNRLHELKKSGQKFFMAVGFARPHLPFSAPKKYWDAYDPAKFAMPQFINDPKGAPQFAVKRQMEINNFTPVNPKKRIVKDEALTRNLIHGYYASMSYMDAQLGRVIDALKVTGLDKNTIVVLWGDHGYHLGDHGSWTKHSNYEQATHIPLLMVVPGVTEPGSVTKQITETVDIYPTLAELAGISIPKTQQAIDGTSMLPVLQNANKRLRDHAYHVWRNPRYTGLAIRTERYRLVKWLSNKGLEPIIELYDYQQDPLETENVASKMPQLVQKLEATLAKHPQHAALFKPKKNKQRQ
ncbi:iduronate-2-sulfatase [Saccharobesus litoralis]|uniref:Iduronate-2-sulfatase n=2 Tax=Saccharobesus litoralis TaxID=2172099 RepID=A0A2S0VXK7_9ALTE|nr:iduronate-2-sulfatase [Saccharobesus litoralis]